MLDLGLLIGIFGVMFWLGLELRASDFRRVLHRPKPFLAGIFLQTISLPAIAFSIVFLWPVPLSTGIVTGLILLAASPGGVTSNMFTRLAGGDTALSISLTAFMTLASIVTVPAIFMVAQWLLGGGVGEDVSVLGLALTLFVIVTLPVTLGIFSRKWFGRLAIKAERTARHAIIFLLFVILAMALSENFDTLVDGFGEAAILALALNVVAFSVAIVVSGLIRATPSQATALSLECGLQSTPAALTLVILLDLPAEALLPAAFYGVWMIVSASLFSVVRAKRGGLAEA